MKDSSEDQNPIKRPYVASLDAILGKEFPVLDRGFIRVMDYMGSDEAIVQAARVSYGKGTKTVQDDRGLIRYLLRHRHTSPFEMCEIKFHVRAPMDAWRQWIRHRTANVNEYSTRYSLAIDAAQQTESNSWRLQSSLNKQGSQGFLSLDDGKTLSEAEAELHLLSEKVYKQRIDAGVAREQARKDLPLATYTEAYWKIDLHNLLNFLALRMAVNAQLEIRMYAETIGEKIVARWCPLTWEAFREYRIDSLQLSSQELRLLKAILNNSASTAKDFAIGKGMVKNDGTNDLTREGKEFQEKVKELGIELPWIK